MHADYEWCVYTVFGWDEWKWNGKTTQMQNVENKTWDCLKIHGRGMGWHDDVMMWCTYSSYLLISALFLILFPSIFTPFSQMAVQERRSHKHVINPIFLPWPALLLQMMLGMLSALFLHPLHIHCMSIASMHIHHTSIASTHTHP
jgi:hypothetical protein